MRVTPGASRQIYLDHNSTTPMIDAAREAMLPFLAARFGNASSIHLAGQGARFAIEAARESVAALAGVADPRRVVFTSGGTEALNLALRGAPGHLPVVCSAIEHPAVLETAAALGRQGRRVTIVPVSPAGVVSLDDLASLVEGPALVAVMHANNEVGSIQPIGELARGAGSECWLVVDAVQSAGRLPIVGDEWGWALVALSAHKIGGPQGAGALVVPPGITLEPVLTGGAQERRLRGGTENVAAIAGFGAAAREVLRDLDARTARMDRGRARLESALLGLPDAYVLAAGASRLSNTTCLVVPGVDGESLVMALDLEGVRVSTGAACASGSTEPSHVVSAMGVEAAHRRSCVRFSLAPETSDADIDRAAEVVVMLVARMRGGAASGSHQAPAP